MIKKFIHELNSDPGLSREIVHHEEIPERKPSWRDFTDTISSVLLESLKRQGITRLYSHQAEAVELAFQGKDVVVVTPTASGKTLCYNIPVFQASLDNPDTRALYLFPIKALGQDQLKTFRQMAKAAGAGDKVRAEIYDGDTPSHKRKKILSDLPSVIISNPDMVHAGILPFHHNWEDFFRDMEFLVLDELHTYKGVFGSHIIQVLRRLFRIADQYGSRPRIIASSATIDNPGELAYALTGREFNVVNENGAPASARHFLFINPKRLSTSTLASRLFFRAIEAGLQTIAFTKARKITELIYTWTIQNRPRLREFISAYRAGYLPEERREIERKLFTGELKGVISTSALEMGIDIGDLDVCLLVGYPGTITTTWQRGGRVGRQDRESLIILVAQQDALDQYFMRHPEAFFKSRFESAAVDPKNKPILKDHLVCAASEKPLTRDEKFFKMRDCKDALAELANEGLLFQSASEDSWHSFRKRPQRDVNLRSIGEGFTIFEEQPKHGQKEARKKRAVIGTADSSRVHTECHQGAIYLHRANQYQITRLDLERRNIFAKRVRVNYYTQARKDTETEILDIMKSRPVDNFIIRFGNLKVTEQVTSYEKRSISSQERLSVHKLDLPPMIFETTGLWIEIEEFISRAINGRGLHYMGGIHALEHGAIALFPLFALCDRDDVGGISYTFHPQVKKSAIFIYDGYPGGVGLAERCYEVIEELLAKTLDMIEGCDCENGCPACVHSPKCGSGNVPIDKAASILILKALLGREDARSLIPRPSQEEAEEPPDIEDIPAIEDEPQKQEPRIVVFDLETRRGYEEVGGWENTHLMGLAVGVVWDSIEKDFTTYFEKDVEALIVKLRTADLVVGFNISRFDYGVLKAYTGFEFKTLPTFDILKDIFRRLGYRLGLGHLAEKTLRASKSADGVQSLKWVREGRMDMVEEYCRHDVELTRDLFYFGIENQHLVFEKRGIDLKLPVDWELDKILCDKNPDYKRGSGR